jgi:pimeloyl-ACP methyl ester carboxylesterase
MGHVHNGEVRIHFEQAGDGTPVVFAHEFGGDYRSWEPQIRYLSRFHLCVAFNARGYPPSDVPATAESYSQNIFIDDLAAVLDGLGFTLRHPDRVRSAVLCGCGYGSDPQQRPDWLRSNAELAETLLTDPVSAAEAYARVPTRMPFRDKDPRGWAAFEAGLKALDPVGASLTLKGVQPSRPGVFDLEEGLAALEVPTLIIVGDSDGPALAPAQFFKRSVPGAALCMFPRTGHAVNAEEPALFNHVLFEFLSAVDAGRWGA